MAMDWVLPRGRPAPDESVASFVTRRLGREAFDRVAEPMIGTIYTADAATLSLAATMPRFLDLERRHGSVIRGLVRARSGAPPETGRTASAADGRAGYRYDCSILQLECSLTQVLDRPLEFKQTQCICNCRAVFTRSLGYLFLCEVEFLRKPLEGPRLLERIQVLSLEVLDERHLQRFFFRYVTDDHGNARKFGALSRAPAPFSGDELEAAAEAADYKGPRQFVKSLLAKS
jgi:hypothetical protein